MQDNINFFTSLKEKVFQKYTDSKAIELQREKELQRLELLKEDCEWLQEYSVIYLSYILES